MSLIFIIFLLGFFCDSCSVMEEFSGFEVFVENGVGFLRDWYFFNSNNNFSSWLNVKGFFFLFNSWVVVGFVYYKFNYLG